MAKIQRKRRTTRIYCGPPGHEMERWFAGVIQKDAKQTVKVNGSIIHALKGRPGATIGCGISNMVADPRNRGAFPHPFYIAAVTKSTLKVVDRLKPGGRIPASCVLYRHNYPWITEKNDDRTLKRLVQQDPSIMERSFIFHPPRKRKKLPDAVMKSYREKWATNAKRNKDKAPGVSAVHKGALARMIKAKLTSKAEVAQMIQA